jgi:6-phosphofructokinase
MHGGSFLGTRRQTPELLLPQIALNLEKHNIHGLFIVGGFEAFRSAQVYHFFMVITTVPKANRNVML